MLLILCPWRPMYCFCMLENTITDHYLSGKYIISHNANTNQKWYPSCVELERLVMRMTMAKLRANLFVYGFIFLFIPFSSNPYETKLTQ